MKPESEKVYCADCLAKRRVAPNFVAVDERFHIPPVCPTCGATLDPPLYDHDVVQVLSALVLRLLHNAYGPDAADQIWADLVQKIHRYNSEGEDS